MGIRKCIISKVFILSAILFILTGCGGVIMPVKNTVNNFSRLLEAGNLGNLTLMIYYIDPLIITRIPINADSLIHMEEAKKIVVHGNMLSEHIDLFKQLNVDILIPVEQESILNARLVYTFEWNDDNMLIVAMGINDSVFVNGFEVQFNAVFADIIKPFLTEDSLEKLAIFFMQNV